MAKNLIYEALKYFTMVPEQSYIQNLHLVGKFSNIKGVVVECGTWKGGMIAGISKVLGNQMEYHLFDSFEGLPKATNNDGESAIDYQKNIHSENYYDNCKADINGVKNVMSFVGTTNYKIYKGWFHDTLPGFNKPIAILRLDGDWYNSTIECLEHLYDLVVPGGLIIIDDYYAWDGCTKAVHDFFSKRNKPERIMQYNNTICFIVKGKNGLL